jgi:fucose 4-O-acetylase-like acetyltransferase
MYLVIMGHAKCAGGFGAFYGAFFMPMFFIISGFLEKERLLKDTVIYGIKTLIIPFVLLYVLYSTAFVISGIIIDPEYLNKPFSIIKPFIGIFIGENGFIVKYGVFVCGPLWFVLALFWIKIANSIFKMICKNNNVYYSFLVFLMPFIIIILKHFEVNLPLSLDSAMLSFPFFAIGKISKRYSWVKERTAKENMIIAVILFTMLYFTYKINLGIDVNNVKFGNNIFLFYIFATIGSFAVINLSMAIYKTEIPIVTLISKGMIIILAVHWYFTTAIGVLDIEIENII